MTSLEDNNPAILENCMTTMLRLDYNLQQEGIISPVKHSHWAAPIVPPEMKKDNSVPICGDFKVTINQASPTECYPIPRVEELLSKLSGQWWIQDLQKGGGHKIMDACCLYYHTFVYLPKPQDGRWSKIVLLQKDLFLDFMPFLPFFPFSEHFQSKS